MGGEESNCKGVFYYYTTLTVTISKYHANFVYDWPGRHTHNLGRVRGKGSMVENSPNTEYYIGLVLYT
jgi:hypothetical protein